MPKPTLLIMIALSLFLLGCPARSLFPLFETDDLVVNPALVGAWVADDGMETYLFQLGKDKTYDVTLSGKKGDTAHYTVQLGKIGRYWFLDSFPEGSGADYHMIGTHIIHKVRMDGDTLTMASLEGDWLRDRIKSKTLTIDHVQYGDEIVLTASPAELQKFLLAYADNAGAFPNPGKLARMK